MTWHKALLVLLRIKRKSDTKATTTNLLQPVSGLQGVSNRFDFKANPGEDVSLAVIPNRALAQNQARLRPS
jgi:hypothetical protein